MPDYKLVFRQHAIQRMYIRNISVDDVRLVMRSGELIKEYEDDQPYPSKLILGWVEERPLHIVVAENHVNLEMIIITVYEPDPQLWDKSFRKKRL